ncbi:hypothetical protein ACFYKX_10785 [Cytobacillus sp. FJAT-54145]|uniref:Uncharacterized protein n=1 Tax=Cytobacillus spartinae TaxID=3299023 RepID=A0ABW6KA49_9BACI
MTPNLSNMVNTLTEKEKQALTEAVSVIWLNDKSDYLNGLWDVIRVLVGEDLFHHKDWDINQLYKVLKPRETEEE